MWRGLLITIAGVFAVVGGLLAYAWTPDRSLESLKPRWAPPPSKFVTLDGVSVHLRDEGPLDDPHPIILIHGTASSLHTWEGWVGALKQQHRVVRFDLPGAGLSTEFPDDDYRMDRYVRFMARLFAELEIKRATLVGNSRGGHVAWEMAAARPDLVERLVLIDARGYPSAASPPTAAEQLAQIPVVGPFVIEHFTPRSLIETSVTSVVGDPRRLTPELVDRYYELFLRAGNRRALVFQIQQESYADFGRIKMVAAPTLIMWGALDHRVPVTDAERFHRDIARSQLVVFDGLGHIPQEEDPARTLKAFQDFLAATPLS